MDLHELAPVGGRATSGRHWCRLERFAKMREDFPDRPRIADRNSAATGGCQQCEGQGWFRTGKISLNAMRPAGPRITDSRSNAKGGRAQYRSRCSDNDRSEWHCRPSAGFARSAFSQRLQQVVATPAVRSLTRQHIRETPEKSTDLCPFPFPFQIWFDGDAVREQSASRRSRGRS